MLAYWLGLCRKCSTYYETYVGEPVPIRCSRKEGHTGPHRSPFGMEWR